MQRRDFLATAATVGVAATISVSSSSPSSLHAAESGLVPGDQRAKAKLRFCSQLGIIPGGNDEEKLKWMKQNGFEAFEIGRLGDNYLDWKKRADDAGLRIASICIGSFGNKLTDEDPEKRKQGFDELKVQLERAGELGANGVVYVPATGKPDRPNWRIRELTVAMLKELGPFAAEHKTHIILEPLRRGEAWFLRQVGDAAQIAKDAGVPGVAVLGDTYHMYTEETDDMAAIIAGGEFVKHIHLGNGTKRQLPGQDDHSHVKLMRGLKYIGYTEFISYECGVNGDKTVEVPKSVEYLKKCWEEA
ncbi:MAG: sugar phosphate isomerase/epimerase [Planctomycetaceae bacterium]|jgi:sugar phosphate isomerase/epimerase|nr:sugar phosphate isomerase/epimerase [Planctomycetaceae bacterium]